MLTVYLLLLDNIAYTCYIIYIGEARYQIAEHEYQGVAA